MEKGNGGLTYIKDFDIAVADSAGYAVDGAVLSVSVDIRQYRKAPAFDAPGVWCLNEDLNRNGFLDAGVDRNTNGVLDKGEQDLNGNGVLDAGEDLNGNGVLDIGEDLNKNGVLDNGEQDLNRTGILDTNEDLNGNNVLDANEDLNRNGVLDLPEFEDLNGNGKLEPRKADVVVYFPGSNKTDASGRAQIRVEWAQNFATWLRYVVKVTTSVAGSEGMVEKAFVTQYIKEDEEDGSFRIPQYGYKIDCTDPL
jgi:hypothetical protein